MWLESLVVKALDLSHTRTVVRECCKDDDQSQWERPKFDCAPHPNPLTDRHQNLPRVLHSEWTNRGQGFQIFRKNLPPKHRIRDTAHAQWLQTHC